MADRNEQDEAIVQPSKDRNESPLNESVDDPKLKQEPLMDDLLNDMAITTPSKEQNERPLTEADIKSFENTGPGQDTTSEESLKERTQLNPNIKEENLLLDTNMNSKTIEDPKPDQKTMSEELGQEICFRVQETPMKEDTSLIDKEIHSKTIEDPNPEQDLMSGEFLQESYETSSYKPLQCSDKMENPLIKTNIPYETIEEPEPEQAIMSEELVKDKEQGGIFEKPLCLISSEGGRFEVVEETVRELERITLPLNVVAIAGLYRTGKSYLMNRLAGQKSGFLMGSSIESTTKGIWAWCRQHPVKESEVLLLLDTEGLGDATKGNIDHDNKLFTLTTLLSSTLVYNVMSAFNQDAIEKLTYVTMLSKNLKVSQNESSDDDLERIMPQFVLCVRDFNLELVQDGKEVTEDEYLETCLKTRDCLTEEDEKFNRPRECIKKFFTRRKVFTFDRPANRQVMRRLDLAREEDLNKDFVQETDEFLEYIYTCQGKLLPDKSPLTGSMMGKLLREYAAAISCGNVPCVEDAVMIMSRQENEKNTKQAVVEYTSLLQQMQLPVYDKLELFKMNLKFKEETLSGLRSNLLFDKDDNILKRIEAEMDTIYEKVAKRNSDLLYDKFTHKLNEIYDNDVKANIQRGKYAVSGGHALYERDMRQLFAKYAEEFKSADIEEKLRAQRDFERKMLHENNQILQEDKLLSEKKSEDVMIKKLDDVKKDMIKAQRKEARKLEAKFDEQRAYYQDKMKRDQEKAREREYEIKEELRETHLARERETRRYERRSYNSATPKEKEKRCIIT